MKLEVVVIAVLLQAGPCRAEQAPEPAPVHVELHPPPREGELSTIELSAEAHDRLGITTTTVSSSTVGRTRMVGGFVVSSVGANIILGAPLAGVLHPGELALEPGAEVQAGAVLMRLVPLAPVDRDLRAQATRTRDATKARLELTQTRVERIRSLIDTKASSARALEEALAELAVAESDDRAAQARERALRRAPLDADVSLNIVAPSAGVIRTIAAKPGQAVAAGAAVIELAGPELWLRVPIYAGDLEQLVASEPVRIARLGQEFGQLVATPVLAPPSADPLSTTVDRFYAIDDDVFTSPGERVLVELPLHEDVLATSVPASAVVVDAGGGTWVYECLDERRFRRRRVDVLRRTGQTMLLERGPEIGTCVVEIGALELFGAEFGVSH